MSKTILLDAGHGGKDPGAISGGIHEADCVLKLVMHEANLWRQLGIEPVLTRDSDQTVPLGERTALENRVKPTCFIAHHMDAGPVGASGATIWLHSSAPDRYIAWATDVMTEINKVGLTSNRATTINKGFRGSPRQDYAVNRDTVGPSMLLELGFITNATNRAEFNDHYKDYARAIVIATCRFIGVDSSGLDAPDSTALRRQIAELQAQNAEITAELEQAERDKAYLIVGIQDLIKKCEKEIK